MANDYKPKLITKCWLYGKTKYTEIMLKAIKEGERIEKNTDEFISDVALPIKRSSAPNYLLKILNSKNVVLFTYKDPMPKPIRVFCAKDVKKGSDIKVFIDVTNAITLNKSSGRYVVNENLVIAYLIAAKINMIYYKLPGTLIKNSKYVESAATIYAKLFTHIIDYLANISVIPENRDKMLYYASQFFMYNVLGMKNEERISEISCKISGVGESVGNIYNIAATNSIKNWNIKEFLNFVGQQFKIDKLSASVFVSKWMYLYGSGTMLGIEFFPSFVQMITDSYIGVYTNNQKTIEKVTGLSMVEFGKLNIYDNNGIM